MKTIDTKEEKYYIGAVGQCSKCGKKVELEKGDIKLISNGIFSGVDVVFEGDFTTIDMQGFNNCIVSLDISSGYFKLLNSREGCLAEFNLRGGEIELDESCTGGDFYIEGYGTLFGDPEELGMNVKANHLIALETIPIQIWNSDMQRFQEEGTAGKYLTVPIFMVHFPSI